MHGCTLDGASLGGPQTAEFLRCEVDTGTVCTTAFGNDAACAGNSLCRYYLSPPVPSAVERSALCSLVSLDSDPTGTANLDTGAITLDTSIRSKVHSTSAVTEPCPVCSGDTTAHDGARDGTCIGGEHDGNPCDTQGFHGTFANEDDGVGLSLDCPPLAGQNVSGAGLALGIDLTTGTATLPFQTNCEAPFPPPPAFVCACGVCSLDTGLACVNNADCDLGTQGTCTTNGGGLAASRQPNACSDVTCTDVGGDRGECSAGGPSDALKYCDGMLRGNGDGHLFCSNNADCDVHDSSCPGGDCGLCTSVKVRPCFNDPIVASGAADPDAPLLAATFCMPATLNSAVNQHVGWPGPARMSAQSSLSKAY